MTITCEHCKHWIQMEEHYGKCVLYGLEHCTWTPADATCDEWEGDDDNDLIRRADAIEAICMNDCGGCRPNECGAYLDKSCDVVKALSALPSAEAVTHGRLIDADALSEKLCETTIFIKDGEMFQRMINDAPTVSAEAVQGEWIMHGEPPWYVRECSECGTKWHQWSGDANPNYCGHCGAKMKGGDSE